MPRPIVLEIKLLACLLLLTSTGCAPMFNVGSKDLAFEPPSHKKLDRPINRNLGEFKIDPLKFEDFSNSQGSAVAKDSLRQVTGTIEPDPTIHQPAIEPATIPPKEIHKLIRLEPIFDAGATPGTKASVRSERKSESEPLDASTHPNFEHSAESVPVALAPEPASGGDFVASTTATATRPTAIPSTTTTADGSHNDFASTEIRLPENGIAASPPTSEPIHFVSSQMEQLVPPFANHPDEVPFVESCDLDLSPETLADAETKLVESASGIFPPLSEPNSKPIGMTTLAGESDTVANEQSYEQAIASSMNSNTDDSVSALIEVPSEPVVTASASPAVYSESRLTWQNQLRRTIEVFEDEIDHAPESPDTEKLKTGLTMLRALETDFGIQATQGDDPESELKEYWSHQIQAINELLKYSSASKDRRPSASLALEHLHLAVNELAAVAELKLAFAAFCTKVTGFGQYSPFENSEFDSDQSVLVYCEIENFAPLLETKDGLTSYQTQLSSSFWITNDAEMIVQQQDYPAVTDNARNLRRDFFMHLPVTFAKLPSGKYFLHIKVRDHGSGKTATLDQALEFSIR